MLDNDNNNVAPSPYHRPRHNPVNASEVSAEVAQPGHADDLPQKPGHATPPPGEMLGDGGVIERQTGRSRGQGLPYLSRRDRFQLPLYLAA